MLLEQLVKVVSLFNDRLDAVESTLSRVEQRTEQILEYVGEPKGELGFRTRHRPTPEELRRVFQDEVGLGEECAELGMTFSYAMYLGLVPENGDKIRELLAPVQIAHLKSALECYQKMNDIRKWMETAQNRTLAEVEGVKEEIQRSIELKILDGNDNVRDQLHKAQDALRRTEEKVEKAIGQLDDALKASEDATAKAKNIAVSNGSVTRRVGR